jgi:predicted deacylase
MARIVAGAAVMAVLAGSCATAPRQAVAQGTALAVPCATVLDSGKPGPTVFILGGVHGDEPSGVEAALAVEAGRFPLRAGRILVLPAANPAALALGERRGPDGFDLNRSFPGRVGPSASDTEERAAAIYAIAASADLVIDLHEEGNAWPEADLPTLVFDPPAAELVFDLLEMPELRSLGFAFTGGSPSGSLEAELGKAGRKALLVEAPARLPEAERVSLDLRAIEGALRLLGMVSNYPLR